MLVAFPLLIIPVAIYNMIAFLTPPDGGWASPLATVRLVSGRDWTVTFADALIGLALVLLLFEIAKTVRPGGKSVIDHLLSVLVFLGMVAEFVMVGKAATSTFAVLCGVSLVDAVGGIVVSIRVGRRLRSLEPIGPSPAPPQPAPSHPPSQPLESYHPVRAPFEPAPPMAQSGSSPPQPATHDGVVSTAPSRADD
ncbi:MAG: hypothetical protein ABSG76_00610 [Xanthobacteraceae bacterium]